MPQSMVRRRRAARTGHNRGMRALPTTDQALQLPSGGRVTVPTLALCVVAAWGCWAATWGALFLVQSVAGLVRDREPPLDVRHGWLHPPPPALWG